mgnify:CR=1 FL=1|tara:strand:- start:194 stop:688 length:495 start_codon:yes stop_codon:yes gene_type:complete
MRTLILLLMSVALVQGEELKLLGKTIIYEDGSWVNPDEPKFKLTKPKTWLKRNYVRHYMQGSQELTDSIIKINFKEFVEAGKTGDQIKMNEFIELFQFDKTRAAIKNHPEAVVVPAGMALGSAAEGSKGTVMATVGLLKNVGTLTLKAVKFLAKPVTKVVQVEK